MKAGNTGHISNVLGTQLPTLGLKWLRPGICKCIFLTSRGLHLGALLIFSGN